MIITYNWLIMYYEFDDGNDIDNDDNDNDVDLDYDCVEIC